MERKIGEIFEFGGEWYQCLVENDYYRCKDDCVFYNKEYDLCDEESPECIDYKRSDNTNVIFKKLEKVGEPYAEGNSIVSERMFQKYRTYEKNFFLNERDLLFTSYGDIVSIEIKQKQEDMEEKKLNLKPFDLEAAKAGKPVCTRNGHKARIICFDAKGDKPIIALVEAKGNKDALIEKVERYFINGHSVFEVRETNNDLMMLPEKKEGWVNVYKGLTQPFASVYPRIYKSKEEAINDKPTERRIDTVKISWEE